ncbi:MAG: hypothetical protein GY810_16855 [Aureispira sp.]|nr:hypothetical protein [Aureispira sp.]
MFGESTATSSVGFFTGTTYADWVGYTPDSTSTCPPVGTFGCHGIDNLTNLSTSVSQTFTIVEKTILTFN